MESYIQTMATDIQTMVPDIQTIESYIKTTAYENFTANYDSDILPGLYQGFYQKSKHHQVKDVSHYFQDLPLSLFYKVQ